MDSVMERVFLYGEEKKTPCSTTHENVPISTITCWARNIDIAARVGRENKIVKEPPG